MEKFDLEEHEANGHTPHHLFAQQRAERAQKIRDIITRENLGELKLGKNINFSLSGHDSPINILK